MITYIVGAALDIIRNIATVFVEDTDILILLVYFSNLEMLDVYLWKEAKKYYSMKFVNIRSAAGFLSSNIVHNIPFIHAWSICDTTSTLSRKRSLYSNEDLFHF